MNEEELNEEEVEEVKEGEEEHEEEEEDIFFNIQELSVCLKLNFPNPCPP